MHFRSNHHNQNAGHLNREESSFSFFRQLHPGNAGNLRWGAVALDNVLFQQTFEKNFHFLCSLYVTFLFRLFYAFSIDFNCLFCIAFSCISLTQ